MNIYKHTPEKPNVVIELTWEEAEALKVKLFNMNWYGDDGTDFNVEDLYDALGHELED